MISFEDCVGLCGLTADEVAAIAEHEHIPHMAAAALGRYLLVKAGGPDEIRKMLVDDIRAAVARKDVHHAAELVMAMRHFLEKNFTELAMKQATAKT